MVDKAEIEISRFFLPSVLSVVFSVVSRVFRRAVQ